MIQIKGPIKPAIVNLRAAQIAANTHGCLNGRKPARLNRLTKIARRHYGAVGPFLNPRKDRRLHRCDERNAERSRDGRKPVVQKPDKKKKGQKEKRAVKVKEDCRGSAGLI